MITCVCKYTPIELLKAFGAETEFFTAAPRGFDRSDAAAHANLCGFGKALLEEALAGRIEELVLVNCCDMMRRACDVIAKAGCCRFLFLLDLPHADGPCQAERFRQELLRLKDAYAAYSGRAFSPALFRAAFAPPPNDPPVPYVGVLGARAEETLLAKIREAVPLPVRDLTCVGARQVTPAAAEDGERPFAAYARALLAQIPCRRMADTAGRRALFNDPQLAGVVYHTLRFCDFYGIEYAGLQKNFSLPLVRVETDFTAGAAGQLGTRLDAFRETLRTEQNDGGGKNMGTYFAGIDSGSTSTDAVIVDKEGAILGKAVLPTGGNIKASAAAALEQALIEAGLRKEDLAKVVSTGYGRNGLETDGKVTEITCHAKGAHRLYPKARTVIDIGGQDSKVISMDGEGRVLNFVMNDKCAAGTGRFLEAMARTLDISLDEISTAGLDWQEDITISSMCTVFAESEVISLVAESKTVPDIVHGLNKSIAVRVTQLAGRVGGHPEYMITGGVARNRGVVQAIEERLKNSLYVDPDAQICGAYGAALLAAGL